MSEIRILDLDQFQMDPEVQTRMLFNDAPLEVFRELYCEEGPEALPPVVVFHDPDDVYWLADGHYRVLAARAEFGEKWECVLPADVREGTKRDAALFAAAANAKHGQPLSALDKRRVVRRLLKDPEWSLWSDREIARHTGTSHVFVGSQRKELEREAQMASGNGYQMSSPTRTVQRGGTTYPMHTGNIGHAQSVTPRQDNDDGMEAVITGGLDDLMDAWREANYAARRTFREWMLARPIEDYGPITTSEDTQRYNADIAKACGLA